MEEGTGEKNVSNENDKQRREAGSGIAKGEGPTIDAAILDALHKAGLR